MTYLHIAQNQQHLYFNFYSPISALCSCMGKHHICDKATPVTFTHFNDRGGHMGIIIFQTVFFCHFFFWCLELG